MHKALHPGDDVDNQEKKEEDVFRNEDSVDTLKEKKIKNNISGEKEIDSKLNYITGTL